MAVSDTTALVEPQVRSFMVGEVDALLRTRQALPFWARYSRAVRVGFFAPNTRLDVYHGLGTTPDGMFTIWSDASITAVPGVTWNDQSAALQASAANAHAVLLFYTLREEPERGLSAENVGKYTPTPTTPPVVPVTGNWTPVLGGTSGASGQNYAILLGSYIKLDRLVIASFEMALNAKGTINGIVIVQNLPFTPSSSGPLTYCPLRFHALATNWITVGCVVLAGNTFGYLQGLQAAGTSNAATNLATTDISNTTGFAGTLVYQT